MYFFFETKSVQNVQGKFAHKVIATADSRL